MPFIIKRKNITIYSREEIYIIAQGYRSTSSYRCLVYYTLTQCYNWYRARESYRVAAPIAFQLYYTNGAYSSFTGVIRDVIIRPLITCIIFARSGLFCCLITSTTAGIVIMLLCYCIINIVAVVATFGGGIYDGRHSHNGGGSDGNRSSVDIGNMLFNIRWFTVGILLQCTYCQRVKIIKRIVHVFFKISSVFGKPQHELCCSRTRSVNHID